MRGWRRRASAHAFASATVTETPRRLAPRTRASGRAWTVTWKVGMVSAAVMVRATARSMEVIGRPSPGACTSGSVSGAAGGGAAGRAVGCARSTSSPVITPPGPVPCTCSRLTPSSPARRRA